MHFQNIPVEGSGHEGENGRSNGEVRYKVAETAVALPKSPVIPDHVLQDDERGTPRIIQSSVSNRV